MTSRQIFEIPIFTFADYTSLINLPSNNDCMMRVKFNFSLVAKRSEATDGDGFYPHFRYYPGFFLPSVPNTYSPPSRTFCGNESKTEKIIVNTYPFLIHILSCSGYDIFLYSKFSTHGKFILLIFFCFWYLIDLDSG